MDSSKNQLVEKLNAATNILVTVSRNPSVDQLAACLGLTLLLNKYGKHATAVYSGSTPSTIEFLEPENTIEKNTDSLRDFIIALDKSKADKLRYKVEDEMVRIFITPYRTSLTADDLVFSQGDFNVDAVIALGVSDQQDFDEAITSHGRILHDAAVIGISTHGGVELGSINWSDAQASSLSELVAELGDALDQQLLDGQIATALLTGIVAETARFSNEKTTPRTMSISAQLMAAGANQQLVATQLDEPEREDPPADPVDDATNSPDEGPDNDQQDSPDTPEAPDEQNSEEAIEEEKKAEAGTLEISHDDEGSENDDSADPDENATSSPDLEKLLANNTADAQAETTAESPEPPQLPTADEPSEENAPAEAASKTSRLIMEPPSLTGRLTANSEPEALDPSTDPLSVQSSDDDQLLNRPSATDESNDAVELPQPVDPAPSPQPHTDQDQLMTGFTPPPPAWVPPSAPLSDFNKPNDDQDKTLSEIEAAVNSVHIGSGNLDDARSEVERALSATPPQPEPVQALGAQPLGDPLHEQPQAGPSFTDVLAQTIPTQPQQDQQDEPLPDTVTFPGQQQAPTPPPIDPNGPPPVPPPIPFNFGPPQPPQQ